MIQALSEAVGAAVVEERAQLGGVSYRFQHAFFRQTLYEELIAPRRIRLHQQIARALEVQHAQRLDEHAAELAEHFSHSSDPEDLRKAVEYGERAGLRAMGVYDYGEAIGQLERALSVQDVLDPTDAGKRCDLLMGLCEAHGALDLSDEVLLTLAEEAYGLAEQLGDSVRAAAAAFWAPRVIFSSRGTQEGFVGVGEGWVKRMDRHALPNSREQVIAHILSAAASMVRGEEGAWESLEHATQEARRLGHAEALAAGLILTSAFGLHGAVLREGGARLDEAARLAGLGDAPSRVSPYFRAYLLRMLFSGKLASGDLEGADTAAVEAEVLAERTRDFTARSFANLALTRSRASKQRRATPRSGGRATPRAGRGETTRGRWGGRWRLRC